MPKSKSVAIVKKSNALIRGHMTLKSVWEPRIIALLASKVHRHDTNFQLYEIPLSDVIGAAYGGKTLEELKDVVSNLMGRVITINESPTRIHKYNIFSRCTIDSKKGTLELRFDADLKTHFLDLKERFTQYDLREFLGLSSIYSQRLFEILKSWNSLPEITIEFDDLCAMLDVPSSSRKNFAFFRRRVLEKAHKDITEGLEGSLWFDWEPIKRGNKVVRVRFIFSKTLASGLKKNQVSVDAQTAYIQQYQKKSNDCFERYLKRGQSCTPNLKNAKCKYCIERGRLWAKNLVQQATLNFGP